jgi:endonuclease/exonuclease/phosphatase family metal-dependent hydrolase
VAERAPIRIATYNVHGCVGTDGRRDVSRVGGVLGELDASLVALQEVDNGYRHPSGADPLHALSRASGLHVVEGPTLHNDRGRYGNALLLSRPPLAVRRVDMSVSRREPRGALDVDVDLGPGPLRVVVTHLGQRTSERRAQVRQLVELVESAGHQQLVQPERCRPVVLMGDFNDWAVWSLVLRPLDLVFGRAPVARSFPSWRPMFCLDRIWAAPPDAIDALRAHRSPLARRASDHLPVRADLRLS